MWKLRTAALAALALGACQAVSSRHVDFGAGPTPHGLQYAAPKALMKVELVAYNGALSLEISQPFLVGDPEATYVLSTTNSLFSDNRFFFVVNPQTRLLTHIHSVTTGKANEILKKLAESIGGLRTAPRTLSDETVLQQLNPAVRTPIYSTIIDPMQDCRFGRDCPMTRLKAELHARGMAFLGCGPDAASDADPRSRNQCSMLRRTPDYFDVRLEPLFDMTGDPGSPPSACGSSICYRAPAPYLIRVRIPGGLVDESRLIMIPNKSPVLAMDLPGGVFATARSRVDLVQGMPATVGIDQGSELLEIVSIPLDIIDSFFEGASRIISIRIDSNADQKRLMDSDLKRQQDVLAYERRRRELEAQLRAVNERIDEINNPPAGSRVDAAAQQQALDEQEERKEQLEAELGSLTPGSVAAPAEDEASFDTFIAGIADPPGADADALKAAQDAAVTTIVAADDRNLMAFKVLCPDVCPKAEPARTAAPSEPPAPDPLRPE